MDPEVRRQKGRALAARIAALPAPDAPPKRALSTLAQLVMDSGDPVLAEALEDVLDNEATIVAQSRLDAYNIRAVARRAAHR
jgi:hypothetical protein